MVNLDTDHKIGMFINYGRKERVQVPRNTGSFHIESCPVMSGSNLPCLQFHFSENKGNDKGSATLDVTLLDKEELLGDLRFNACSDLCPATIPTVSKAREVGPQD